jgi:hypothetical protein
VALITSPFLLENLIGACIDAAMPRVDDTRSMTITAERGADGAVIRLQHLAGIGEPDIDLGGEKAGVRAMLAMLGGRLSADGGRGELVLEISNGVGPDSGSQP